ncbi:flavin monoamine oxidase family protein [Pelomonas sp. SE-A7]|uniref:flavin monoamine oxidase family protein n=1 Tax=Pelomonas sp. SE-A7 TaxID=3054953 RepID=UPI00259CD69D|nr:flavin monoamine oxidase family protein [Pelomonas sp. SE-A7]MDM4765472.1 flavin monoamine oxidase family protein [Pelomonas sp. SE-A7]
MSPSSANPTRRQWLLALGRHAGSGAAYAAMAGLGLAHASPAATEFALQGAPKGKRVLIVGAGVAGMVAGYELQRAGYQVQLIEFNQRAGGRCWTLRGGDRFTELGGATQVCRFDKGQYLNPGPWRIPHHHHGLLSYCRRFGVELQPFIHVNHNAYLHSPRLFGGKPQRLRSMQADGHGHVSELLAKVVARHQLDQELSVEDREKLREALREFGGLDREFRYRPGPNYTLRRGFEPHEGQNVSADPPAEQPVGLHELLDAGLWGALAHNAEFDFQMPLFQPVGGMDAVARALAKAVGPRIQYRTRVRSIGQDEQGVSVECEDLARPGSPVRTLKADYCVVAIPLSVLSQLEIAVGPALKAAISACPYAAAAKVGLQFKRRFWEQDEGIYGGISYTELPNRVIGYPSHEIHSRKGVLLGAYAFGPNAFEYTAMAPERRLRETLAMVGQVHPQAAAEFECGISVGWHRSPFSLGCFGEWDDEARRVHYPALLKMDGRIVLAGEHASLLPGWQEGAVLSARHAITELHRRASARG